MHGAATDNRIETTSFGETGLPPNEPSKPKQVTLFFSHADGKEPALVLSGNEVPDPEDWEDVADRLRFMHDKSIHGSFILLRMEDNTGKPYLRTLRYDVQLPEKEAGYSGE